MYKLHLQIPYINVGHIYKRIGNKEENNENQVQSGIKMYDYNRQFNLFLRIVFVCLFTKSCSLEQRLGHVLFYNWWCLNTSVFTKSTKHNKSDTVNIPQFSHFLPQLLFPVITVYMHIDH